MERAGIGREFPQHHASHHCRAMSTPANLHPLQADHPRPRRYRRRRLPLRRIDGNQQAAYLHWLERNPDLSKPIDWDTDGASESGATTTTTTTTSSNDKKGDSQTTTKVEQRLALLTADTPHSHQGALEPVIVAVHTRPPPVVPPRMSSGRSVHCLTGSNSKTPKISNCAGAVVLLDALTQDDPVQAVEKDKEEEEVEVVVGGGGDDSLPNQRQQTTTNRKRKKKRQKYRTARKTVKPIWNVSRSLLETIHEVDTDSSDSDGESRLRELDVDGNSLRIHYAHATVTQVNSITPRQHQSDQAPRAGDTLQDQPVQDESNIHTHTTTHNVRFEIPRGKAIKKIAMGEIVAFRHQENHGCEQEEAARKTNSSNSDDDMDLVDLEEDSSSTISKQTQMNPNRNELPNNTCTELNKEIYSGKPRRNTTALSEQIRSKPLSPGHATDHNAGQKQDGEPIAGREGNKIKMYCCSDPKTERSSYTAISSVQVLPKRNCKPLSPWCKSPVVPSSASLSKDPIDRLITCLKPSDIATPPKREWSKILELSEKRATFTVYDEIDPERASKLQLETLSEISHTSTLTDKAKQIQYPIATQSAPWTNENVSPSAFAPISTYMEKKSQIIASVVGNSHDKTTPCEIQTPIIQSEFKPTAGYKSKNVHDMNKTPPRQLQTNLACAAHKRKKKVSGPRTTSCVPSTQPDHVSVQPTISHFTPNALKRYRERRPDNKELVEMMLSSGYRHSPVSRLGVEGLVISFSTDQRSVAESSQVTFEPMTKCLTTMDASDHIPMQSGTRIRERKHEDLNIPLSKPNSKVHSTRIPVLALNDSDRKIDVLSTVMTPQQCAKLELSHRKSFADQADLVRSSPDSSVFSHRNGDISHDVGNHFQTPPTPVDVSKDVQKPISHGQNLSQEQSPRLWTAELAGFGSTSSTIQLPDGHIYKHPPLPPGWCVEVSRSKGRPFYRHPDWGSTYFPPIALPSFKSENNLSKEQWVPSAKESLLAGKNHMENQTSKIRVDYPNVQSASFMSHNTVAESYRPWPLETMSPHLVTSHTSKARNRSSQSTHVIDTGLSRSHDKTSPDRSREVDNAMYVVGFDSRCALGRQNTTQIERDVINCINCERSANLASTLLALNQSKSSANRTSTTPRYEDSGNHPVQDNKGPSDQVHEVYSPVHVMKALKWHHLEFPTPLIAMHPQSALCQSTRQNHTVMQQSPDNVMNRCCCSVRLEGNHKITLPSGSKSNSAASESSSIISTLCQGQRNDDNATQVDEKDKIKQIANPIDRDKALSTLECPSSATFDNSSSRADDVSLHVSPPNEGSATTAENVRYKSPRHNESDTPCLGYAESPSSDITISDRGQAKLSIERPSGMFDTSILGGSCSLSRPSWTSSLGSAISRLSRRISNPPLPICSLQNLVRYPRSIKQKVATRCERP